MVTLRRNPRWHIISFWRWEKWSDGHKSCWRSRRVKWEQCGPGCFHAKETSRENSQPAFACDHGSPRMRYSDSAAHAVARCARMHVDTGRQTTPQLSKMQGDSAILRKLILHKPRKWKQIFPNWPACFTYDVRGIMFNASALYFNLLFKPGCSWFRVYCCSLSFYKTWPKPLCIGF